MTKNTKDFYNSLTLEPGLRLRDVACPQCKRAFRLAWDSFGNTPRTLVVSDCPSGGVYSVSICCPWCDYEEEL